MFTRLTDPEHPLYDAALAKAHGGAIDMTELTLLLEGIDLRVPRLRRVQLQRVD